MSRKPKTTPPVRSSTPPTGSIEDFYKLGVRFREATGEVLAWDAASQPQSVSRYQSLTTASPVAGTQYTFDAAGRLTSLGHAQGGTTLAGVGRSCRHRRCWAEPAKEEPKPLLRLWRAGDGAFQERARLVAIKAETVVIENEDGKLIELKIADLSELDQRFVNRTKRQGKD